MAVIKYFDEATQEWLPASMGKRGPEGPAGDPGEKGDSGEPGIIKQSTPPADETILWLDDSETGTEPVQVPDPAGEPDGKVLKTKDGGLEYGDAEGGVTSVNTKVGDVVLDAEDVGAAPTVSPTFSSPDNGYSPGPGVPSAPQMSLDVGPYDPENYEAGPVEIRGNAMGSLAVGWRSQQYSRGDWLSEGNTGVGQGSQAGLDFGSYNVAVGAYSQEALSSGAKDVAIGAFAHEGLTTGASNVAVGFKAASSPANSWANRSTTASRQTVIGTESGQSSPTQADDLTTLGYRAIGTTGSVAVGSEASAEGISAVSIGQEASASKYAAIAIGVYADAPSGMAIAVGSEAVSSGGGSEVSVGYSSKATSYAAVAVGPYARATANYAIAIGNAAGSAFINSVALGSVTKTTAPNQVHVGDRHIMSDAGPIPVIINTDGDPGTTIYVGSIEPSNPQDGDVWFEVVP